VADLGFKPDGVYGDVPYRVTASGQIDAMLSGRIVRLNSVEQLVAIVSNGTALSPYAGSESAKSIERGALASRSTSSSAIEESSSVPANPVVRPRRRRRIIVWIIIIPVVLFVAISLLSGSGPTARRTVVLLNAEYGSICDAALEGWGQDTLRVDWTSRTTKINSIQVLAAVGAAKDVLYRDGVRYFKFPNDAGGYNIIDWRTGEKTSVDERAPYYFP
jgi:hypothetical protein